MKPSTKKLHAAAVTGTFRDARAWDSHIAVVRAKHAHDMARLDVEHLQERLANAIAELSRQEEYLANARAAARIDRGRA